MVAIPDKVRLSCLADIYSVLYNSRKKILSELKEDPKSGETNKYFEIISNLIELYGEPGFKRKGNKSKGRDNLKKDTETAHIIVD